MPYRLVKCPGGYKVRNTETGHYYSHKVMTKRDAEAQLRILNQSGK